MHQRQQYEVLLVSCILFIEILAANNLTSKVQCLTISFESAGSPAEERPGVLIKKDDRSEASISVMWPSGKFAPLVVLIVDQEVILDDLVLLICAFEPSCDSVLPRMGLPIPALLKPMVNNCIDAVSLGLSNRLWRPAHLTPHLFQF